MQDLSKLSLGWGKTGKGSEFHPPPHHQLNAVTTGLAILNATGRPDDGCLELTYFDGNPTDLASDFLSYKLGVEIIDSRAMRKMINNTIRQTAALHWEERSSNGLQFEERIVTESKSADYELVLLWNCPEEGFA